MMRTLRFDHRNLRCIRGHNRDPSIPAHGVNTPINMSAEGCMFNDVLPKRIAVDVIVVNPKQDVIRLIATLITPHVPSESKNQAAKYLKVLRSFLISCQRSIPPKRFQAATTSARMLHLPSGLSKLSIHIAPSETPDVAKVVGPGSHTAAGIEKTAHHIPLNPMAKRRENVLPLSFVTGIRATSNRHMPAPYPRAMPNDEMRDVARESSLS